MKHSRLNKIVLGILIIFGGFGLLLDNLGLIHFNPFKLFPLLIVYFGMRLYSKNRRIIGGLLAGWGVLLFLGTWFNIDFDDAFGVVASLGVVYVGFRLIRSKKHDFEPRASEEPSKSPESMTPPESIKHPTQTMNQIPHMRIQTPVNQKNAAKESRSSLIGDFHLTSGRFELRNLHIWHGVGDVVIDLSRALIQEEEAFLVINGWVGGITIYVPVDLPVSVAAEVTIGDMEVFGHRQGGLNRHVVMSAENYEETPRKVKIIVSLIVGDIDVKYI